MASVIAVTNDHRTHFCESHCHKCARLDIKRTVRRSKRAWEIIVARIPRNGETKNRGSGRRNARGLEKLTPNI